MGSSGGGSLLYASKATVQGGELAVVPLWKVTPATAGYEDFRVDMTSAANGGGGAGTYNHGVWFGWNSGRHSGAPVTTGKPAVYMGFEDGYFDTTGGDGQQGVEFYTGYVTPDGVTLAAADLRPIYWRLWDSTTNTANKGVLITLDIGNLRDANPLHQGSFNIYGGLKQSGGVPLFSVSPDQVTTNRKLSVSRDAGRTGAVVQATAQDSDAQFLIKANAAGGLALFSFQPNGGAQTFSWTADQFGELYLHDDVNSRILANFIGRATSDLSTMQLSAVLQLNNTAVAAAAAGTGTALPATPQGYFQVKDSAGTLRKVPYYV